MSTSLLNLISDGIAAIENSQNGEIPNTIHNFMRQQNIDLSRNREPSIDIAENDSHFMIDICIPGVKKNDIKVDFYNNKLTIKGKRVCPYPESEYKRTENYYGDFERIITMPICVTNPGSVDLMNENGVLTIYINKQLENRNKFSMEIPVKNIIEDDS